MHPCEIAVVAFTVSVVVILVVLMVKNGVDPFKDLDIDD